MNEITNDVWQRSGCSLLWEKELLLPLLNEKRPYALHEALRWKTVGFPAIPARQPVVVAGLQTCLELQSAAKEAEDFLRQIIQPFIRRWQEDYPESGLIFGMNNGSPQWKTDADDRAALVTLSGLTIAVTAGLWNGASRDANRIILTRTLSGNKSGKSERIFGGIYVRRLS